MRILITGGAGFIGSNFIHYWHKIYPKDQLIILDKLLDQGAGKLENLDFNNNNIFQDVETYFPDTFKRENIILHKIDLACSQIYLNDLFKYYKPDLIVNFSSDSHVDNSISSPLDFWNNNVLLMVNLLEACRKYRVPRIIHISSDEVLRHEAPGERENGEPFFFRINEDRQGFADTSDVNHPDFDPSSVYSASKASQEMLCNAYKKTWGMDITILRSCNVYGPRQHIEKLIPKTISRALNNEKIPVYAKGDQWRDWLYVEDFARGLEIIIKHGGEKEIYHISAQDEQQNIKIIENILYLLDKPYSLIENVIDRLGHDVCYSLSSAKLRALGWKPQTHFHQGILKTIKFYRRLYAIQSKNNFGE